MSGELKQSALYVLKKLKIALMKARGILEELVKKGAVEEKGSS